MTGDNERMVRGISRCILYAITTTDSNGVLSIEHHWTALPNTSETRGTAPRLEPGANRCVRRARRPTVTQEAKKIQEPGIIGLQRAGTAQNFCRRRLTGIRYEFPHDRIVKFLELAILRIQASH